MNLDYLNYLLSGAVEEISAFIEIHYFFVTLTLFIGCGTSLIYQMKKKYELKAYREFVIRVKSLLDAAPNAWCAWEEEEHDTLMYSPLLQKMLSLKHSSKLSLAKIIKCFQPEAPSLEHYIEELVLNKKEFSAVVMHKNDVEIFLVNGMATLNGYKYTYSLWFSDITQQVRNEQAQTEVNFQLEEERDSLKELLDLIPTAAWIKSAEKGIIFCNKAYADVLETTPELVVTEKKAITTWRKNHLGMNITDQVLKSKQRVTQRSHSVVQGERRLLEITEDISSANAVMGFAVDKTEIEKVLAEKESITRSIQEALERLPNALITYDGSMRVEFFNQAYVKMFHHDADWLAQRPSYGEVVEDLRARRQIPETPDFQKHKKERLALFSSIREPIEDTLYYPDGRAIRMITAPYHDNGLLIFFHDVSEWLSLERRHNTLLAVHKHILDNLFEGASVYASNNRLTLYNRAFVDLWGFDEEYLKSGPHLNDVIDRIHPMLNFNGDWNKFKERIFQKVTSREAVREGRVNLKNERAYDFAQTPLPDGSHLLTSLNVTDRYRIEKALLERNEALEIADKIKTDFLNRIYTTVQEPLRTLAEHLPKISAADSTLDAMMDAVVDIKNHVEEFYELSHVNFGEARLNCRTIKVTVLLEDIFKKYQKEAIEREIDFTLDLSRAEGHAVSIDLKKFHQAYYSLMKNAFLYNDSSAVVLTAYSANDRIYIVLICKEYIPFMDVTKKSRNLKKGLDYNLLGVGYSLVRHYMDLHEGTLTFENNAHNGTSVVVSLPREAENK